MKDYMKEIEAREAKKAKQLLEIDNEIVKINVEIDKEVGAATHALSSGDQGTFKAARAQTDYLKGRKEYLQKQRAEIAARPTVDREEAEKIIREIDDKAMAKREKLVRSVISGWDNLSAELEKQIEALEGSSDAGLVHQLAKATGIADRDIARGSEDVRRFIGSVSGSRELYLLRQWLNRF